MGLGEGVIISRLELRQRGTQTFCSGHYILRVMSLQGSLGRLSFLFCGVDKSGEGLDPAVSECFCGCLQVQWIFASSEDGKGARFDGAIVAQDRFPSQHRRAASLIDRDDLHDLDHMFVQELIGVGLFPL